MWIDTIAIQAFQQQGLLAHEPSTSAEYTGPDPSPILPPSPQYAIPSCEPADPTHPEYASSPTRRPTSTPSVVSRKEGNIAQYNVDIDASLRGVEANIMPTPERDVDPAEGSQVAHEQASQLSIPQPPQSSQPSTVPHSSIRQPLRRSRKKRQVIGSEQEKADAERAFCENT